MDLRKFLNPEIQEELEDPAIIKERARKKRILKKRLRKWGRRVAVICFLLAGFLIVKKLAIPGGGNDAPASDATALSAAYNPASEMIMANDSYIVCVDPGHGGTDPGCVASGRVESDDNMTLARLVKAALEKRGVQVILTRTGDETLELTDRTDTANEGEADVLLSLHRNYVENDNVSGVEVWINSAAPEDAVRLANGLLSSIEDMGKMPIRSVKTGTRDGYGNYVINSHSSMTSCILEMGYMSNSSDNLSFDRDIESYAATIANSVVSFLNEQQDAVEVQAQPLHTMLAGVPLP